MPVARTLGSDWRRQAMSAKKPTAVKEILEEKGETEQ
jgi:hypothetical protein